MDPTGVWSWLPRAATVVTLGVMILYAGMWIGDRDTGTAERLRVADVELRELQLIQANNTERFTALERISQDNILAITRLIQSDVQTDQRIKYLSEQSAEDRKQLNMRVGGLEADRVAFARLEQRLIRIEERQASTEAVLEQIRSRVMGDINFKGAR